MHYRKGEGKEIIGSEVKEGIEPETKSNREINIIWLWVKIDWECGQKMVQCADGGKNFNWVMSCICVIASYYHLCILSSHNSCHNKKTLYKTYA